MRVVTVMAHPDDAEVNAGGLAARMAAAGHRVTFLSMCRGENGHHRLDAETTARRRQAEAEAAAAELGASYECLGLPECAFDPTAVNRLRLIARLRGLAPDLIVTHPPGDYHVDHRNTAQLAADALFLLQVPRVAPEAPVLRHAPRLLLAVCREAYAEGLPLWHAAPVDGERGRVLRALARHESQMFEWLPWVSGWPPPPPADDPEARLRYVDGHFGQAGLWVARRHRACLEERHGERGRRSVHAEALYATPASGPADPAFLRELLGT